MLKALKKHLEFVKRDWTNYINKVLQKSYTQSADDAERCKTVATNTAQSVGQNSSGKTYNIPQGKQNRFGVYAYELPQGIFTYTAGMRTSKDNKNLYDVYVETESHFELLGYDERINETFRFYSTGIEKKHVQHTANTLLESVACADFDRIGHPCKSCADKRYICFSLYQMLPKYKQ